MDKLFFPHVAKQTIYFPLFAEQSVFRQLSDVKFTIREHAESRSKMGT